MKLLTYRDEEGIPRLGLLHSSYIYDVEKTTKYLEENGSVYVPAEMIDVLNMDGEGFQQVTKTFGMIPRLSDSMQELMQRKICRQVEQTSILLPFTPRAVICTGNNYRDHLEEKEVKDAKDQKGDDIELFHKLAECVIGPYDPITHSSELTEKLDYENELAVVIGREAWQVSEEEAKKCIFGYTVFNDVSARDRQMTAEGCQKLGLAKISKAVGLWDPVSLRPMNLMILPSFS
jgi:2-keto-4-pentenoate hydratase/2-oxohepta-3-ene-1,7-dioic acid hydratase in catechol pathway